MVSSAPEETLPSFSNESTEKSKAVTLVDIFLRWRSSAVAQVYLVCVLAALVLALLARKSRAFPGDLYVAQALQAVQADWWTAMMLALSNLGELGASLVVLMAAIVALFALRARLEALVVAGTASAHLFTWTVKLLVDRPRPEISVVAGATTSDSSFPSGHVLNAVVLYGLLFYLAWVNFRPSLPRTLLLVVLASPIALMGISRVYVGAHWPSDVLGGYLLGGLLLAVFVYVYQLIKRRSMVPRIDC